MSNVLPKVDAVVSPAELARKICPQCRAGFELHRQQIGDGPVEFWHYRSDNAVRGFMRCVAEKWNLIAEKEKAMNQATATIGGSSMHIIPDKSKVALVPFVGEISQPVVRDPKPAMQTHLHTKTEI